MEPSGTSTERRTHSRAPLRLPARIRWLSPLGLRVEMTETVDVSRDGVLVRRNEPCELFARVWIVFPFVRGAGVSVQPETPGRITRVAPAKGGGYWVGLRVENADRGSKRPAEQERRRCERVPCALPIFIRLAETPWPEESMTCDLSSQGVRLETSHIYSTGQVVIAQIPWGEWSTRGQIWGRVVRTEALTNQLNQAAGNHCVALEWVEQVVGPLPS